MQSKLSDLVDNLSETNNKDYIRCWERKNVISKFEFIEFRDNRLKYKCKECNDISAKSVNKLTKKFPNTYKFCDGNCNKFFLLLRKGVHPYEYMDSWEKFNEASLPDKIYFYSELNKEGITDEDYVHAQKVWKVFEIKILGEYHDLYVQGDTLLLLEIFENFRDGCIDTCKLNPVHFLSALGLAWQACLKKTGVKLELLTDIDMLVMLKKELGVG